MELTITTTTTTTSMQQEEEEEKGLQKLQRQLPRLYKENIEMRRRRMSWMMSWMMSWLLERKQM